MTTVSASSRCGAVAALVLVLVLTGSAAHAEVWRHHDARQDVVSVVYDDDGAAVTTIDPDNETADITRIVAHHAARRVLVDVFLRDLSLDRYTNVDVRLQTPRGNYLALVTQGRYDRGSVMLMRGDDFVSCSRTAAFYRPRLDKVRVQVPRSCIEDPRWVRVAATFTSFDVPEDGAPQEPTFHDDALATGEDSSSGVWSKRLRPAPPVPPDPLTLQAGYGWMARRPVGKTMTDGLATVEVAATRGVVIERVRAPFDSGVRVLGVRLAPPDREIGGVLVHQWPPVPLRGTPTVPARGAHLTPTPPRRGWLLIIGYQVRVRGGTSDRRSASTTASAIAT